MASSSNGRRAAEARAAALAGANRTLPTGERPTATPASVPSSGGFSDCAGSAGYHGGLRQQRRKRSQGSAVVRFHAPPATQTEDIFSSDASAEKGFVMVSLRRSLTMQTESMAGSDAGHQRAP